MEQIKFEQIRRGDIFLADLGMTVGAEQSGTRHVLIIQNDKGNRYSPTVIIAPLTRKEKRMSLATHVVIDSGHGLHEKSVALLEQVRTIDRKRLLNYIGTINGDKMQQINAALCASLDLA